MTAPNMATITASLERSLQNCSLNHHQQQHQNGGVLGEGSSSSDDIDAALEQNQLHQSSSDTTTLELNSHVSLPYHWEQCLDLKTGEVYYINWRNRMKAKEDPRTREEYNGGYYSDDSSYDSEESSSGSSPQSSSRDSYYRPRGVEKANNNISNRNQVLVVAGCKTCLMYIMVPKQVQDCPKCCGQLLHFDRSENGSP